jgi:hypothetical protein
MGKLLLCGIMNCYCMTSIVTVWHHQLLLCVIMNCYCMTSSVVIVWHYQIFMSGINCYCMVPMDTAALSYETCCLRHALFMSYDDDYDEDDVHHQTDVASVSVGKYYRILTHRSDRMFILSYIPCIICFMSLTEDLSSVSHYRCSFRT